MFPEQLAKSGSEHAHQVALFAWAAVAREFGFEVAEIWEKGIAIPAARASKPASFPRHELTFLHAIPNGGSRGDSAKARMIRGAALKAEGVRSGVPDVFLPYPNCGYHGLYIEMKKPAEKPKRAGSRGGLSDDQIEFRDWARANNYGWAVCYSWKEAANMLRNYIEWKG